MEEYTKDIKQTEKEMVTYKTDRKNTEEKLQLLMTYQNSHLLWKNTDGLLTPDGLFPILP